MLCWYKSGIFFARNLLPKLIAQAIDSLLVHAEACVESLSGLPKFSQPGEENGLAAPEPRRSDGPSMTSLLQTTQPAKGESEPLRQLYVQYNRLVFARFLRLGFDSEEARDLLHKTFVQAIRGWSGFRGDSTPKTWLIKIADRVALNVMRDAGRRRKQALIVSIDGPRGDDSRKTLAETLPSCNPEDSPLERLMGVEKNQALVAALSNLPPQMQQIAVLRYLHDYSYQEIANCLRISLNTVRSQLHEARKRLRRALTETLGDTSP